MPKERKETIPKFKLSIICSMLLGSSSMLVLYALLGSPSIQRVPTIFRWLTHIAQTFLHPGIRSRLACFLQSLFSLLQRLCATNVKSKSRTTSICEENPLAGTDDGSYRLGSRRWDYLGRKSRRTSTNLPVIWAYNNLPHWSHLRTQAYRHLLPSLF